MQPQSLIDLMHPMLHDHSHRVQTIARLTGAQLGLDERQLDRLQVAAVLHDVGKVEIDEQILLAPRGLTDDEWRAMKRHPQAGYEILRDNVHPEVAAAVLAHHERWDGTGYPNGLAGEEIPILARVIAVADAFDAMTSTRAYRGSRSPVAVVDELTEHAGTQFDPAAVAALRTVVLSSRFSVAFRVAMHTAA